ncbi:MAG: PQQ-dependent sugar dehydrogenase [Phycisphaeraceae bacterium]
MLNKTPLTCGLAAVALFAASAAAEPITNPIPEPIQDADIRVDLQLVADGLVSPVWGTTADDGTGRMFVVDQVGKAWVFQDGQLSEQPYLDVSEHMVDLQPGFDERGFLGLAFHPDFADEHAQGYGRFYTFTSEPFDADNRADFTIDMPEDLPANHISVVSEWRVADHTAESAQDAERRVVVSFDEPQFNHNGGALLFGPDKMLYISLGDGGAGNDIGPGHTPETGNGQDSTNPLGAILRINPLGDTGHATERGQYTIPEDNPFLDNDDVLDVIYAYGLRNVFRMAFDGDALVAADVGQAHLEIINIIESGGNYGWNLMEGSFYFDPTAGPDEQLSREPLPDRPAPDNLLGPVAQYDHDEGTSITGGFVYRGKAVQALQGLYVFGDWQRQNIPGRDDTSGRLFVTDLANGEIFALPVGDGDSHIGDLITGFAQDHEGELYVLTNNTAGPQGENGRIWKIVPHE